MKKALSLTVAIALTGCATQTPQMKDVEPDVTGEQQRAAQVEAQEAAAPEQLALKRKIAVGRLSMKPTMAVVFCAGMPRINWVARSPICSCRR